MKYTFILIFLNLHLGVQAQDKHKFYIYWGWNRAFYSHSDITFSSPDYNFTLKNVVAHDKPVPTDLGIYLNPGKMTVPQYNIRLGYFITPKYSISLGIDHMKYVVQDDQSVTINGSIHLNNNKYNGIYQGESIVLAQDFLRFEHTDGLNYLNSDIRRHVNIYNIYTKNKKIIRLDAQLGIGIGIYYPRTSSNLLGKKHKDEFKLSGIGYNGLISPKINVFDIFFLSTEFKVGQTIMSNIETSFDPNDYAIQTFWYFQYNFVFGAEFKLFNKKTKSSH